MPKQGKIEKYELEEFLIAQIKNNIYTSDVQLAKLCNEELARNGVKDTITNMAIKRFRGRNDEKKMQVIKSDKRKIEKAVAQEFDIIQSQITLCQKMFAQLDIIEQLPERLDRRYDLLLEDIKDIVNSEGSAVWITDRVEKYIGRTKKDLQNYIMELTAVSREIRENNKFMVDLTAKVHEYNLVQEYIKIFIGEFRQENELACNNVLSKLASNPRLRQLALEHQSVTVAGGVK